MGPRDLKAYKIYEGEQIALEFEGGIKVEGTIVTGTRNLMGEIILITFENCTVTHGDNVLFQPEWGLYHMAVGQKIVSAYNGPADLNSFDLMTHQITESTIKSKKDEKRLELERYYEQIRHYREGKNTTVSRTKVFQALKKDHPKDWLLPVELYELAKQDNNQEFQQEILQHLENIKRDNPKVGHLIDDGLQLVDTTLVS